MWAASTNRASSSVSLIFHVPSMPTTFSHSHTHTHIKAQNSTQLLSNKCHGRWQKCESRGGALCILVQGRDLPHVRCLLRSWSKTDPLVSWSRQRKEDDEDDNAVVVVVVEVALTPFPSFSFVSLSGGSAKSTTNSQAFPNWGLSDLCPHRWGKYLSFPFSPLHPPSPTKKKATHTLCICVSLSLFIDFCSLQKEKKRLCVFLLLTILSFFGAVVILLSIFPPSSSLMALLLCVFGSVLHREEEQRVPFHRLTVCKEPHCFRRRRRRGHRAGQ